MVKLREFDLDKNFERMIKLEKGKYSSRMKNIGASHKTSLHMQLDFVIENSVGTYMVKSESRESVHYTVRREQSRRNCSDPCRMVCADCNICAHQFSCTCVDHLLKLNICKHIHLTMRYIEYGVSILRCLFKILVQKLKSNKFRLNS